MVIVAVVSLLVSLLVCLLGLQVAMRSVSFVLWVLHAVIRYVALVSHALCCFVEYCNALSCLGVRPQTRR